MNPLASPKYAGRLLMVLAAVSSLFLAASCSSSSSVPVNQQGFGVGNLSGTYVFSSEGSDSNGYLLAMAGAFSADGKGNVTAGTMDIIDPNVGVAAAQTITAGSYSVGTDGRGQAKLTSAVATFVLDFVLTATSNGVSSHGLVTEFDSYGSGSGTLDLQTAVTSLSQLANPYAFNISGVSGTAAVASTGSFTLNSSGAITAGIQDVNLNASGSSYAGMSVSGAATLGTGTGPGALTLTSSSFNMVFDFYPIDPTHLKVIEVDGQNWLVGDAFNQTGATLPSGPMVFSLGGGTSSLGPVAAGGLMTGDGAGNFSGGLEDVNNAGVIPGARLGFSGTAAGPAGVGGRVQTNLSGFSPATTWVVYPSVGGMLMLEMDTADVMQGVGYAQTATSFNAGTSAGYGLNLSGYNGVEGFEIDDIAQFNATTGTSNNMTGVLDENDEGLHLVTTSLNGTYTPDSPVDGRGEIVVPSIGTPLGFLDLVYYVVDSSTAIFIEVDGNPAPQVAAGTFEAQGSAQAGVALSHMALVHPALRPHALRQK